MKSAESTKPLTVEKSRVRRMTGIAMFIVLIAAGAWIKIPVPVCPFTLQFLFTAMAGLLLGPADGVLAVLLYTALGLLGVPIFAEGGGLWYVLKPSFGYMFGFAGGTWLTGKLAGSDIGASARRLAGASFAGLMVVYGMGMVYYYLLSNYVIGSPIGLRALFLYCFLLAVPGDICLCALAGVLAARLRPALRYLG